MSGKTYKTTDAHTIIPLNLLHIRSIDFGEQKSRKGAEQEIINNAKHVQQYT